MTQIAIYGASGFGREAAWLVESCSNQGTNYEPVCFIDDNEQKQGQILNNIPVMSLEEAKKAYPQAFLLSVDRQPATTGKAGPEGPGSRLFLCLHDPSQGGNVPLGSDRGRNRDLCRKHPDYEYYPGTAGPNQSGLHNWT